MSVTLYQMAAWNRWQANAAQKKAQADLQAAVQPILDARKAKAESKSVAVKQGRLF